MPSLLDDDEEIERVMKMGKYAESNPFIFSGIFDPKADPFRHYTMETRFQMTMHLPFEIAFDTSLDNNTHKICKIAGLSYRFSKWVDNEWAVHHLNAFL